MLASLKDRRKTHRLLIATCILPLVFVKNATLILMSLDKVQATSGDFRPAGSRKQAMIGDNQTHRDARLTADERRLRVEIDDRVRCRGRSGPIELHQIGPIAVQKYEADSVT